MQIEIFWYFFPGENLGHKIKTIQIRQQVGFLIYHHHIMKAHTDATTSLEKLM
jgi:hypothetical protein